MSIIRRGSIPLHVVLRSFGWRFALREARAQILNRRPVADADLINGKVCNVRLRRGDS